MKKIFTLLLAFFLVLNTAYIRPVFAENPVNEEPVTVEEAETEEELPEEIIPEEEVVEEQPVEEVSEETLLENDSLGEMRQPSVIIEHYYQEKNPDGSFKYVHDYDSDYPVWADPEDWVFAVEEDDADISNFILGRHLVTTDEIWYDNDYDGSTPAVLIDDFQLIPYVESNGTQFIDTEYDLNETTEVYAKFSLVDQKTNNQTLFGASEYNKKNAFYRFGAEINVQNLYFNYGTGHNLDGKRQLTRAVDKSTHEIYLNRDGLTFDGVFYEANSDPYNINNDLFLFANADGEGYPEDFGSYRLYHLVINEYGDTVRNFYPAVAMNSIDGSRTNTGNPVIPGTYGLYDACNDVFCVPYGDVFTCDDVPFCEVDSEPTMQRIRLYYDLDKVGISFINEEGGQMSSNIYTYYDTIVNTDIKPEDSLNVEGYTFYGWSIEDYDLDDNYDITYFSDEPIEYNVNHLANGAYDEGVLVNSSIFDSGMTYSNAMVDCYFDYHAVYEPNEYIYILYSDYKGNNIELYESDFGSDPFYYGQSDPIVLPYPRLEGYTFAGWVITGMDDCTHYHFDTPFEGETYETFVQASDIASGDDHDKFYNLSSKDEDVIFIKAKFEPIGLVDYGINYYIELQDADYDETPEGDQWDWTDVDLEIQGRKYMRIDYKAGTGRPGDFIYPNIETFGNFDKDLYTLTDKLDDLYEVTKATDIFNQYDTNFDYLSKGYIDMDGKNNPELFVIDEIHSNFSLDENNQLLGGQSINTGLKAGDVYKVDMDVDMAPTLLGGNDYGFMEPYRISTFTGGYMFGSVTMEDLMNLPIDDVADGDESLLQYFDSGLSLITMGGTEFFGLSSNETSLGAPGIGEHILAINLCGGGDILYLSTESILGDDGHVRFISSRNDGTRDFSVDTYRYEYVDGPFSTYENYPLDVVKGGNVNKFTSDKNFYLFGSPVANIADEEGMPGGSLGQMFYSQFGLFEAKIYGKDDVLLRDFVPCVTVENLPGSYVNSFGETVFLTNTGEAVPAGTYGLYDKVENKFYVNEGTGAFTDKVGSFNRNASSFLANGASGTLTGKDVDFEEDGTVLDGYPDESNIFNVFLKLNTYDLMFLKESYVSTPFTLEDYYERSDFSGMFGDFDSKDELYYGDDINNYYDESGNFDESKLDHSIYTIAYSHADNNLHIFKNIDKLKFKVGQFISPEIIIEKLEHIPAYDDGKMSMSTFIGTGLIYSDSEEYDFGIPSLDGSSFMTDHNVNVIIPYLNAESMIGGGEAKSPQLIIGADDFWIDDDGAYHVLPGTEISFAANMDADIVYSIDYLFSEDVEYVNYHEHLTINESQSINVYAYERGKDVSGRNDFDGHYVFKVDNYRDFYHYGYAMTEYGRIPEGLWVGYLPNLNYYPDEKEFKYDVEDLPIFYHYTRLDPKDYTVKYSNNKKAGVATITITAKGGYDGKLVEEFYIEPLELRPYFARITLDADAFKYKSGKIQKPTVKEFVVEGSDGKEYKLKNKTDYYVTYEVSSSTTPGTYEMYIWINENSNYYNDGPIVCTYTIHSGTVANQLKIKGISDINYFDFHYGYGNVLPIEVYDGKFLVDSGYYSVIYDANKPWNNSYLENRYIGTHTVTIEFTGPYAGSITKSFKLKGVDISKATFEKIDTTYDYDNGNEIAPSQTLSYKRMPLYEGLDYYYYYADSKGNPLVIENDPSTTDDDVYVAPTEPGSYKIVYFGNEDRGFTGSKSVSFKINGLSLSKYSSVEYSKDKYIYTGEEIIPDNIKLYYTKNKQKQYLDPAGHYTYEITNNVNAGTATVTYKGIGNYAGTSMKKTFKIEKCPLTDDSISVDELGVQPYGKKSTMPTVVIHQGDYQLVEGVDFTVSCTNNTSITTNKPAVATIKGKGNYSGTLKLEFDIGVQDISNTTMTVNDATTSTLNNPVIYDINGNKLVQGVDYDGIRYYFAHDSICGNTQDTSRKLKKAGTEITRFDIVYPGTIVKVVALGINNYTGRVSADYKIVEEDISKAKVTVRKQYYTGKAINILKEDITIISNGRRLYSDEFDIIGYTNNTNVGTATVTVRGKGKFGGIQTIKFTIAKRPLNSVVVKFYTDYEGDRYEAVNYFGYEDYLVNGTMEDMIITKSGTKLTKNKFKNSNSELTFLGWYCPEIENRLFTMNHPMRRRNPFNYYDGEEFEYDWYLEGSEVHMYASWFELGPR